MLFKSETRIKQLEQTNNEFGQKNKEINAANEKYQKEISILRKKFEQ